MIRYAELILITEDPTAHGVGEGTKEIRRRRTCEVRSVSQTETYLAMGQGLNPELKVRLAYESDYNDERVCIFEGKRYRILRTYIPETNGIELVLQRETKNAMG